jgi:hypothetical protein
MTKLYARQKDDDIRVRNLTFRVNQFKVVFKFFLTPVDKASYQD